MLVVSGVDRATDPAGTDPSPHADRIHVRNRDSVAASLAGIVLAVANGGSATMLTLTDTGITELAAGDELVIELASAGAAGAACQVAYCWANTPALVSGSEVALLAAGVLTDYLAYAGETANTTPPRLYAGDAVTENLWPGAVGTYAGTAYAIDCAVGLPGLGAISTLDLSLDGTSPPDWH
jgi:hypothetical protein